MYFLAVLSRILGTLPQFLHVFIFINSVFALSNEEEPGRFVLILVAELNISPCEQEIASGDFLFLPYLIYLPHNSIPRNGASSVL